MRIEPFAFGCDDGFWKIFVRTREETSSKPPNTPGPLPQVMNAPPPPPLRLPLPRFPSDPIAAPASTDVAVLWLPLARGAMERFLAALSRRDDLSAAWICRGEPALTCWIAFHRLEGWGPQEGYPAMVAWLRGPGGRLLQESARRIASAPAAPSEAPSKGATSDTAWRAVRRTTLDRAAKAAAEAPSGGEVAHFQAVLQSGGAWLAHAGNRAGEPSWLRGLDGLRGLRELLPGDPAEAFATTETDTDEAIASEDAAWWVFELGAALAPLPPEFAALSVPPESLLEALAEFSAGAGHEINNPLAAIAGRAELLARGEADPQRRKDLASIQAQALRAGEMIADLMTFARPPTPHPECFDPGVWLTSLAPRFVAAAAARGLRLEVAAEPAADEIECDPRLLEAALKAVLDNAFEWSPPGGTVSLALSIQPRSERSIPSSWSGAAAIDVEDSGPGWPQDAERLLFLPYFAARQAGRGLGVGLSKAWRLLRGAGGELSLVRTADGRTRARLLLPLAPLRPPAPPRPEPSTAGEAAASSG